MGNIDSSNAVELTSDGVAGFLWPLSRREELGQGWKFFNFLLDKTRELIDQESDHGYALSACFPEILNEFLALNRHVRVYEVYASGANRQILDSWNGRISKAVRTHQRPEYRKIVFDLAICRKKVTFTRRVKRKVGGVVLKSPFARCELGHAVLSGRTVSIASTGLIAQVAAKVTPKVVLESFEQWYIFDPEKLKVDVASDNYAASLGKDIAEYLTNDFQFPDYLATYFGDFCSILIAQSHWHIQRLVEQNLTPSVLWAGSVNSALTRIIRIACLRNGSHIVMFDHGEGIGCFYTPEDLPGRFDIVHEYVAYGEFQASRIREREKLDKYLTLPILESISSSELSAQRGSISIAEAGRQPLLPEKIIYATTISPGDVISLNCLPPGIVQKDFTCRLFSELRKEGYDLTLKPHPEDNEPYPAEFSEKFEATISNCRFEEMFLKGDVIVFDFISSAMRAALLSDRGIVLVDYGLNLIDECIVAEFEKRVQIVKAHFDHENRIQVDWEQVKEAIPAAWEKRHERDAALLLYSY
ncbi:hypothetical protein M9H61_17545 [Thalassospira sp. GO-4]|uniref:hypothetical protein n=1 Tax=Thalassospira sp. GO-4 TaxID=2946605 RepID=UPI002024A8D9|nr:hypothetical protein [Thalassospira sp. GO-4]URK17337.1 hypothetical protein M9H61_17545 [Thalassospira sp. GO-4]